MTVVAFLLVATFVILSLWHLYWLAGGAVGLRSVIPEVDGAQAFHPPQLATLFVALALALCALLVAATAGLVQLPLSPTLLVWGMRALALVFLLRAVGDFRLVGFFKRIRGTRFAAMDSWLYSPLSVLLAAAAFLVSRNPGR